MRFLRSGLVMGALFAALGCAHEPQVTASAAPQDGGEEPTERAPRVLRGSRRPVLFAGPEADAAVFGYVASDVVVEVSGPAREGRVPVRIDGALRVKAYVPEASLALRVQKRGRVRGTPTYVGPNDLVQPLGAPDAEGRVRVAVAPRVGGRELGPFEGTYPASGLAAERAAKDAQQPAAGAAYLLPPGRALTLHEAPRGPISMEIPAQSAPLSLTVVAEEEGWLAVRVGEGPYVIGYSQDALSPEIEPPASADVAADAADGLPELLRGESGALKRVAAETRVTFNDQVVAVFKQEGWARVFAEYPDGQVDVFAAVDGGPAVRGLVPREALTEPSAPARASVFDEPSDAQ